MAVGAGENALRGGSLATVDIELGVHEKGPDAMCGKVSYATLWYSSVSAGVNRSMTKSLNFNWRAHARAALAGSLNSTNECMACVWAGCLTSDDGSEDI